MALGKKDNQYDKFKTPFFKIRIGDAGGNNMVDLPPSLTRLVEKIEITESLAGCTVVQQFNLVMSEGSREPYNRSLSTDTTKLYSDADLTNSSGMLADLQFSTLKSGENGFTSRIPSDIGKVISFSAGASIALDLGLTGAEAANPANRIIVSDDVPQVRKAKYVFEQRNVVEVAWGYIESPQEIRHIRCAIANVQTDFPENGTPTTTITCLGPESFTAQLSPIKPMHFRLPIPAGVDLDSGIPLIDFQDLDVEQTINRLFVGFHVIVSDNLQNAEGGTGNSKVLMPGKSPDQFLRELAKSTNGVFINYYSTKKQKPVVVFLSRNDFLSKEVMPSRHLTTYKGQNSILKSVSVKTDYNGLTGAGMAGIDSTGTSVTATANNGGPAEVQMFNKSLVDSNPLGGNAIPQAVLMNQAMGNGNSLVADIEVSPEADEPSSLKGSSASVAACRNRLVYLEFSALGYPKITPGVIYFGGLGNRYSGQYEVMTVTHTIDSNGYQCRGSAQATGLSDESGVKPGDASKVETPPETTIDVPMFDPKVSFNKLSPSDIGNSLKSAIGGSKLDEYLEDVLS